MTELTHWPADLAACTGNDCELAQNCRRYHGHLLALQQQRDRQNYHAKTDGEPCYAFQPLRLVEAA